MNNQAQTNQLHQQIDFTTEIKEKIISFTDIVMDLL